MVNFSFRFSILNSISKMNFDIKIDLYSLIFKIALDFKFENGFRILLRDLKNDLILMTKLQFSPKMNEIRSGGRGGGECKFF